MSDKRAGNKLPKWSNREDTPGIRVDSGPHVGIIKNNADPSRLGRIQVWIPDLGGDELEPSNWYTVSYESPYYGTTQGYPGAPDQNFGNEQQTYGMWMVPPDINNQVLIIFVMGDPSRGYYFACVPNSPVAHMIPGIARPVINTKVQLDSDQIERVDAESYLPVTELNISAVENEQDPNFVTSTKALHKFQAEVVIQQGLDTDPRRGTITSSIQRDTPSRVFGFSTPGRTDPDEADIPDLDAKLKAGEITIDTLQDYRARQGGHTFVMDDGDIYGDSKLVRLRTSGGHTILMHDTEDIFYIINQKGTAWVELTADGSINVFGKNDINIRAAHDLNLHGDANVNIYAGDTIKMYAGSTIQSQTKTQLVTAGDLYNVNAGVVGIRSGGNMDIRSISGSWETAGKLNYKTGSMHITTAAEMNIKSGTTSGWTTAGELWLKGSQVYLNTSGKVMPAPAAPVNPEVNPTVPLYKQPNAVYNTTAQRWFAQKDQFESVAPFTPTHEPWARQSGTKKFSDGTIQKPYKQGDKP
jgi:hypothetical protein